MIEPSAEELAKLAAAHGAALKVTPALTAGLEQVRIAVRAFDQAAFDRYYDESARGDAAAIGNAFLRQLVWPDHAICARLTMACAALPSTVVRGLEKLAIGASDTAPSASFDPLDETTSDAVLAKAGIDRVKVDELRAQAAAGGIALELVTLRKGGGLVLRAPEPVIFEQITSALASKKGVALMARTAAIASTAWASEDVPSLYRRLPGLAAHVVMPALIRLGGAGAASSFCFDD
jgi:hypothetical protein